MCQFFDIQASGENQDQSGLPGQIAVFGRVTVECQSVQVRVADNQNNIVFDGTVTPDTVTIPFNGIPTHSVRATFDNTSPPIECGDRVTVRMTCVQNATCTIEDTVALGCKDPPPSTCPDSNDIQIVLTSGGVVVPPDQACIPAGSYTGEVVGAPAASQIFWTLQIGVNSTPLGSANPVQFSLPAGSETISLIVTVIVPDCPPIVKTEVLPDREEGDCPSLVSFELRKDGQIVTETKEGRSS